MLGSGQGSVPAEARSLLVLRHEPFEDLGYFEDVLRDRTISFIYSDLGSIPDLAAHRGLIVMGGPQSANDQEMAAELVVIARNVDDARTFARRAQDLLDDVVVRLRPVPFATDLPAVDDVTD